jgi:hypothetical protein
MVEELEKEFIDLLNDDSTGVVSIIFGMSQEIVQEKDGKEAQALNMIVGASFALVHAINNYKEIKNGKVFWN